MEPYTLDNLRTECVMEEVTKFGSTAHIMKDIGAKIKLTVKAD